MEARVQEAVKRNKEVEEMEAVRKKQEGSIQNAEFQKTGPLNKGRRTA